MNVLLFRSRSCPVFVLPIFICDVFRICCAVKGTPLLLVVMSVLIVVPGLLGSSTPTMISAEDWVGARRAAARRVAVVRFFR